MQRAAKGNHLWRPLALNTPQRCRGSAVAWQQKRNGSHGPSQARQPPPPPGCCSVSGNGRLPAMCRAPSSAGRKNVLRWTEDGPMVMLGLDLQGSKTPQGISPSSPPHWRPCPSLTSDELTDLGLHGPLLHVLHDSVGDPGQVAHVASPHPPFCPGKKQQSDLQGTPRQATCHPQSMRRNSSRSASISPQGQSGQSSRKQRQS